MDFLVAQDQSELHDYDKDKVLFVDGSIEGYKAYDHHKTGEKINLDAMPPIIQDIPEVVATTQIDSDAICSAVVVYFGGERKIDTRYADVFRTASTFCDYLIPNEDFDKETNTRGLGLHLYMKEKGIKLINRFDEVGSKERSFVFDSLCRMLIEIIESGDELPNDTSYLNRIEKQIKLAQTSIIHQDELLTAIYAKEFIDPIASYRVITTPLLVIKSDYKDGLFKYSVGVNPKFYGDYHIKTLFDYINENIENGWGGRNIAGGSPFKGTEMPVEKLIRIIHRIKDKFKT
jgi:hypothetical protein